MRPLRFLQIPKTAGSTFVYLLLRLYRKKKFFYFRGEIEPDTARFMSLSKQERQNIDLFMGHAPILTGIEEVDDAMIITILRDPVSRVKSFCQHVAEGKAGYLLDSFPPESFDLDRFLMSGNKELSNMQVKMLINTGMCASSYLIDEMSPSEARDLALENLFGAVTQFGLQEYFDESLILFSKTLNWSMPLYASANARDRDRAIEFTQSQIDHITELNSIDIEFYNAAKSKFLDMITERGFDRMKLKMLQTLNPLASRFIKNKS